MKLREEMPELIGATTWINSFKLRKTDLIGTKPTFIHFWSVSCGLCKKAMPNVNDIRDEYAKDLNMIAVHVARSAEDKDLNNVKKVAKEHRIIQPIFVDHEHTLSELFSNRYVPAYYIFDKDGKLRHVQSGGSGILMLRKRLKRIIEKNN